MSESDLVANLLATARDVLRGEVAPALPGRLRFPAAMIANAMGIAARELEHGPAARAELRALLARLYPDAAEGSSVDDLESRLCGDLRAGRLDRDEGCRLRAVLRGRTRLRLKVSAPALAEKVRTP
jgi:hypothetical protein